MILNRNSFLSHYTDFWGHNDADILEVGNGALTLAEYAPLVCCALWIVPGTDLVELLTSPGGCP